MATLTGRVSPHALDWLHWLYIRGNYAISCDVQGRGDGSCVLTMLPLWSPENQIVEAYRRPADAMRRHAEIAAELQANGWLLAGAGPVTTAA